MPSQLDSDQYTVAWVAALPHEAYAAVAMLDVRHAGLKPEQRNPIDQNLYFLGHIGGQTGNHNVAITCCSQAGTTSAAVAAQHMLATFPNIKFGLMVGIGGGIPSPAHDIRLGDVVVSAPNSGYGGVRQYDMGKAYRYEFRETGSLNAPPALLQNAVRFLEIHLIGNPAIISERVRRTLETDLSYVESGYGVPNEHEPHDRRHPGPVVHYGTIASGNEVVKDATIRDELGRIGDCLCFETEAAGLMNNFPCLVIRGISDYCDEHKNEEWQRHAGLAAAAYAKELLGVIACERERAASEGERAASGGERAASGGERAASGGERTANGAQRAQPLASCRGCAGLAPHHDSGCQTRQVQIPAHLNRRNIAARRAAQGLETQNTLPTPALTQSGPQATDPRLPPAKVHRRKRR
ncbi:purine and uridine phosphorylase [Trichodelitschia bisporula]|uniref:Purine and uridine phosphorylase n=1 Tax=Trichodelitschia bisporula TaxID=703511 RepID=A0A6G1HI30_9PEZI|nr:purine and uridine phosphorylase [Trichodelitschia bisporula]